MSEFQCRERRELGLLIHACVSAITHSSASAAKIAGEEHQDRLTDFRAVRADYAVERARLETFRECLALHERLHGCGGTELPSDPVSESKRTDI
jgi:hypothetical protein